MLGGQRRTYICDCGWSTKDSVRAADMKFKLHQKVCPNGSRPVAPRAFNPSMNGFNGITTSRRGYLQHVPIVAALHDSDDMVRLADLRATVVDMKEEKKQ